MNNSVFGELKVHNPRLKERRKSPAVTCRAVESRRVSRFMSTLGTHGLESLVIVRRTNRTQSMMRSSLVGSALRIFEYDRVSIPMYDFDTRAYLVSLRVP